MTNYLEGIVTGATIMFIIGLLLMMAQPQSVAIKSDRLMPNPAYQFPSRGFA